MEQLIEFIINHPMLTGSFAVLLAMLAFTEIRKGGQTISNNELTRMMNQGGAALVDLRDKKEFSRGFITGAINIPHTSLKARIAELEKYKSGSVILVDAMGQHSGSAGKQLKDAGFEQVVRLSGGIGSWQGESLPLVKK